MDIPGLPQIPTDNLYKFAAVTLLIVSVLSFLGGQTINYRSEYAFQLLKSRVAEEENLVEDFTRLRSSFNSTVSDSIKMAIPGFREEMVPFASLVDSLWLARRRTLEGISADLEESKALLALNHRFVARLNWTAGLALLGACSAFWFWYSRYQRFQDQIVRTEAERAQLELDRTRKKNPKP